MDEYEPELEPEEIEFHRQRYSAYRASLSYVDAALRDAGFEPFEVRHRMPSGYVKAVKSVFARLLKKGREAR